MSVAKLKTFLAVICSVSLLNGCGAGGTVTPTLQEYWGSARDAAHLKENIAAQVSCELGQAVRRLLSSAASRQVEYIRSWVAQIQFQYTIEEKSSFEPQFAVRWLLPPVVSRFALDRSVVTQQSIAPGVGFSHGSEALIEDKSFINYNLRDFAAAKGPYRTCIPEDVTKATLFVQSDLEIYEWLAGELGVIASQGAGSEVEAKPRFAGKAEALSRRIQFQIVTTGNVSPGLTTLRLVSSTSPLFKQSRDRTQQVIITMGPVDKSNPNQLGPTAQASSLASQINAAISASFGRILP